MRVFISIDVPDKVKKELLKIQEKLPEFYGKKTEPENLHLTLKFLGDVNNERLSEIKKRLKQIKFKSFEAEIDRIGFFSPKFIKIIWLHMTNCDTLQKEIDESLSGLFEKEKRFMSHMTIERVKEVKDKKKFIEEMEKIKFPIIKFKVKTFRLKKSELTPEGPEYEIIEEYELD